MQAKVVAILETRTGAHLGEMIARRGGIPLLAPALAEVPDLDPVALSALLDGWRSAPYRAVIFQTGVGTRALFQSTEGLGRDRELRQFLEATVVVARGPKPTGELNSRGVRIDLKAASPFTSETVLEAVAGLDLRGAAVLVQRYGAANEPLRQALEARGAQVREIATYKWALPADTQPLKDLLAALATATVDAVVFTSAVQIQNLATVAEAEAMVRPLSDLLSGLVIASVGPVCSRALRAHGITPTFEADPPKLGPLVTGLDRLLS
jgi:uroporphyrinogen-III synthase